MFYCASPCCLCRYVFKNTSKKFQKIESLWQPSVEQVCWCHFPKSVIFKLSYVCCFLDIMLASQGALVVKNQSASAGEVRVAGSIPGLGRPPGGGHGNPLQYSCLENSTDRGAWRAIVHEVAKSWM